MKNPDIVVFLNKSGVPEGLEINGFPFPFAENLTIEFVGGKQVKATLVFFASSVTAKEE